MNSLRARIEKVRNSSPVMRRRYVAASATIVTVVLLAGYYGTSALMQGLSDEARDSSERIAEAPGPFAVVKETWGDMMEYVNTASQQIFARFGSGADSNENAE